MRSIGEPERVRELDLARPVDANHAREPGSGRLRLDRISQGVHDRTLPMEIVRLTAPAATPEHASMEHHHRKNFREPDQSVRFEGIAEDIVEIAGFTVGRTVQQPGWR
jgi:hypothetical protein